MEARGGSRVLEARGGSRPRTERHVDYMAEVEVVEEAMEASVGKWSTADPLVGTGGPEIAAALSCARCASVMTANGKRIYSFCNGTHILLKGM